jgi:hypothetical protein
LAVGPQLKHSVETCQGTRRIYMDESRGESILAVQGVSSTDEANLLGSGERRALRRLRIRTSVVQIRWDILREI